MGRVYNNRELLPHRCRRTWDYRYHLRDSFVDIDLGGSPARASDSGLTRRRGPPCCPWGSTPCSATTPYTAYLGAFGIRGRRTIHDGRRFHRIKWTETWDRRFRENTCCIPRWRITYLKNYSDSSHGCADPRSRDESIHGRSVMMNIKVHTYYCIFM
jgi:hypothetical protein